MDVKLNVEVGWLVKNLADSKWISSCIYIPGTRGSPGHCVKNTVANLRTGMCWSSQGGDSIPGHI
jgi:hypothetical protein